MVGEAAKRRTVELTEVYDICMHGKDVSDGPVDFKGDCLTFAPTDAP